MAAASTGPPPNIPTPGISPAGKADRALATELMGELAPTKVYRVTNHGLSAAFDMCRMWFKRGGHPHDVEWGFHATRRQATGSIIWTGFNASFAGKAHGTALGSGIYLAADSAFANKYSKVDPADQRCMFICQTLKGGERDHKTSDRQTVYRREQQVLPVYLVYY